MHRWIYNTAAAAIRSVVLLCLCVCLCVCVCNSIMIQTVEEDFTETSRTRAGLVSNMAEPDTRLIRITDHHAVGWFVIVKKCTLLSSLLVNKLTEQPSVHLWAAVQFCAVYQQSPPVVAAMTRCSYNSHQTLSPTSTRPHLPSFQHCYIFCFCWPILTISKCLSSLSFQYFFIFIISTRISTRSHVLLHPLPSWSFPGHCMWTEL